MITFIKRLFGVEKTTCKLYKPNKATGLIELPNNIKIRVDETEKDFGIQQVIELNGQFYGRRKEEGKWVRDPFPIITTQEFEETPPLLDENNECTIKPARKSANIGKIVGGIVQSKIDKI